MMNKLLLSTHWTAEEAEFVMDFLDELKGVIAGAYAAELNERYQAEEALYLEESALDAEDFDDIIPF